MLLSIKLQLPQVFKTLIFLYDVIKYITARVQYFIYVSFLTTFFFNINKQYQQILFVIPKKKSIQKFTLYISSLRKRLNQIYKPYLYYHKKKGILLLKIIRKNCKDILSIQLIYNVFLTILFSFKLTNNCKYFLKEKHFSEFLEMCFFSLMYKMIIYKINMNFNLI